MKLFFCICKDGKIVESAILAWTKKCFNAILPPRKCDTESEKYGKVWIVKKDRRRLFGNHANAALEQMRGTVEEELYGFFALVGIGKRWIDDLGVDWCLFLTENKPIAGEKM